MRSPINPLNKQNKIGVKKMNLEELQKKISEGTGIKLSDVIFAYEHFIPINEFIGMKLLEKHTTDAINIFRQSLNIEESKMRFLLRENITVTSILNEIWMGEEAYSIWSKWCKQRQFDK